METVRPLRILNLTLKAQWFDMILANIKKEEYREMKDYWFGRLLNLECPFAKGMFKEYDIVRFTHGYAKNARQMDVKFLRMSIETGRPEWGAVPGRPYITIFLGEVLSTKNIPKAA